MNQKRVNFNMDAECHALLKSVCALKRITVSEYVYKVLAEDFHKQIRENNQMQTLFLGGTYRNGSKAYLLKELLIEELNSSDDSSP